MQQINTSPRCPPPHLLPNSRCNHKWPILSAWRWLVHIPEKELLINVLRTPESIDTPDVEGPVDLAYRVFCMPRQDTQYTRWALLPAQLRLLRTLPPLWIYVWRPRMLKTGKRSCDTETRLCGNHGPGFGTAQVTRRGTPAS